MYSSLKKKTNRFVTFLVEAVHPGGQNLPHYVRLATAHDEMYYACKYTADVNYYITLANQLASCQDRREQDIVTNIALLETIIQERSEYSYWMAQLESSAEAEDSMAKHQYFIDILEDVSTILTKTLTRTPTPAEIQTETEARQAPKTLQRHTSTLGKRLRTPSPNRDTATSKAARTTTAPTSTLNQKPLFDLRSGNVQQPLAKRDHTCAPMPKMSWAAIAAVKV